ncbi:MAG: SDR family oxidoreductase [Polyangiaceae bacterium]|jgi:NAD(P)-dependent dehydrogenase (short-subunit alcohol dehydrogenase family)|nr:SDR family oxidoreductase [Polyangiaceae bacterium]MBK8938578.1 SDR family oxidoreductase [Polyangiaceae bacterium]
MSHDPRSPREDATDVPSEAEVREATAVLERLLEHPEALVGMAAEERRRLLVAAGQLSRPAADDKRKRARAFRRRDRDEQRARDEAVLASATLRQKKQLSSFLPPSVHAQLGVRAPEGEPAPEGERLEAPRACYVCKADYDRVHFFYHSMCPACAALNFAKRSQSARLDGKVALVTGARIKIGYHTALKLLRAGARVIATTRFPVDAARRFAAEPDRSEWQDRLEVHGLDLRHTPSVEVFARGLLEREPQLDVLVNNAAQTVRRPPAFYEHLVLAERLPYAELPADVRPLLGQGRAGGALEVAEAALVRFTSAAGALTPWAGEAAADPACFPAGQLDGDDQQVDLRPVNSWRLGLADVPTPELLEVHLVNAIAPALLTSRLKPLMMRAPTFDRHVIHVSAMEASFSRKKKTDKHPHTNMAKAALNMMTRTSAVDYARDGIFMNSVDTGWVTDEDPLHHAVRKQRDHDFHAPLDSIDGAARVLDPLFVGLAAGEHPYGIFFKDYRAIDW